MWENLYVNPLFKIIVVIIVGILLLGLMFNLVFGGGFYMRGGEGGHMGYMGGYGISFGGLVTGLLMLLVNVLIIVLVVAVFVGIFNWLRNTFVTGNNNMANNQFVQAVKSDPFLKTVASITGLILGVALILGLFNSMAQPGAMGYGMYGHGWNLFSGYNMGYGVAGLLMTLIRILWFVMVVSLIVAVIIYLRDQYQKGNMNWFAPNNTNTTGGAANTNNMTINAQPTGKEKNNEKI